MSQLSNIFAALSDPTRFAIVERLLQNGELPVTDIRAGSDLTPPAFSRHLNVLVDAGVLTRRARAQQRLYSVRPEALQTISAWAISHREFWEGSLSRLDAALTQEMTRK